MIFDGENIGSTVALQFLFVRVILENGQPLKLWTNSLLRSLNTSGKCVTIVSQLLFIMVWFFLYIDSIIDFHFTFILSQLELRSSRYDQITRHTPWCKICWNYGFKRVQIASWFFQQLSFLASKLFFLLTYLIFISHIDNFHSISMYFFIYYN